MRKLTQTITKISIHSQGDNPVFGASVVSVEMDDEAGGAFFIVSQETSESETQKGTVRLDFEEIEAIREVSKKMLNEYEKGIKSNGK
jgi:hypothetical protein